MPCNYEVLIPIFGSMESKIKNGVALAIIPQIILVKWLGKHPDIIEMYYSEGLYPWVSKFFRVLYGWVPISVGDVLYFILSILAIRYVYKHWLEIRTYPFRFLKNIVFILSIAYFTFHLLWGFNYYRLPISQKFNLSEKHTDDELLELAEALIVKSNELQFAITKDTAQAVKIPYAQQEIFDRTLIGYEHLEKAYLFISYEQPSIKTSIFSTALSYMGYGGYLNPFTHEAQVNGRLPNYRFPVVAGHEIGHQIGYSAENETNFIGYLVTIQNPDIYFQYSAYTYGLAYCLGDIRRYDQEKFKELYVKLNPGIQKNYQEMNDFWQSFENPLEPVFKSIFNTFLKANNQAQGIKSYNAVVSLMVNYHKKYPID